MKTEPQTNTFSEEIQRILDTGNFAPSLEIAMKPTDELLGVMSNKEKAIHTVRSRIYGEYDKFLDSLGNTKRGDDKDVDDKYDALSSDISEINKLLIDSITERIPEAKKAGNLEMRKNYQIVMVPIRVPQIVVTIGGGFPFGDIGFGCESCPDDVYAKCTLPCKQER